MGKLSASAAGGWCDVPGSMARAGYRNIKQTDKLELTEKVGYGTYSVQLRMLL
jgi:hypothetical protein